MQGRVRAIDTLSFRGRQDTQYQPIDRTKRKGELPSTTLQNSLSKWAGQNNESVSQGVIYYEILARTFS